MPSVGPVIYVSRLVRCCWALLWSLRILPKCRYVSPASVNGSTGMRCISGASPFLSWSRLSCCISSPARSSAKVTTDVSASLCVRALRRYSTCGRWCWMRMDADVGVEHVGHEAQSQADGRNSRTFSIVYTDPLLIGDFRPDQGLMTRTTS